MLKNILFDLDGTLTDPYEGISKCILHALNQLQVPSPRDLRWCIGPPLQESFKQMLVNHPHLSPDHAIAIYRERFSTLGLFENQVYGGIQVLLAELKKSGYRLFVATSKPQVYSLRIIEHFDLHSYFEKVYGSELDGTRTKKAELIKFILDSEALLPEQTIMIGDRMHDLVGAAANGLKAIGVTWGYGDLAELERERPFAIVNSPQALLRYFA